MLPGVHMFEARGAYGIGVYVGAYFELVYMGTSVEVCISERGVSLECCYHLLLSIVVCTNVEINRLYHDLSTFHPCHHIFPLNILDLCSPRRHSRCVLELCPRPKPTRSHRLV